MKRYVPLFEEYTQAQAQDDSEYFRDTVLEKIEKLIKQGASNGTIAKWCNENHIAYATYGWNMIADGVFVEYNSSGERTERDATINDIDFVDSSSFDYNSHSFWYLNSVRPDIIAIIRKCL